MKKIVIIFFYFLWALTGALKVSAQATATPTSTPLMNCCLLAGQWTSPSLSSSAGVAVDKTRDRVYATDGISGKILALNYDGSPATAFGGGFVSLPAVFGVAVGKGPYDGVYAVQRNGSIAAAVTKFDANGNVVWTAPGSWSSGTERTLCVDDWGNVYVVTDSSQIYVFDSAGNPKSITLSLGSLGALSSPSGLLMVGLNFYVSDSGNNRIVQFVESGVNTYSYSASRAVTLSGIPYGITADLTGHFYVCSQSKDGYASYDSSFNQLTEWCSLAGGAFAIGVDETGAVYMSSSSGLVIVKTNPCFSQALPAYHGLNPPDSGECFVYPSPVRGDHATLSYKMAESGKVELKVWNERAELVSDVTDQKSAGVQVTPFTTASFASGVYFYSLILTYDSGKVEKIKTHKFAVIH